MPTIPNLVLTAESTSALSSEVLLIGAVIAEGGEAHLFSTAHVDTSALNLEALGVSGAADSLVRIPSPSSTGPQTLVIVGIGRSVTPSSLRYATGSAIRRLAGIDSVVVALPTRSEEELAAIAEGALLGAYAFEDYRGLTKEKAQSPVANITIHNADTPTQLTSRAAAIADAVALTKDLVNIPANDLFPASMVEEALASVADLPITHTVWTEDELKRDGFGGILGVGQGSSRPPRLLRLDYAPAGASRHIALVGKGITFDTGGLSLKPPASMIGMKYDMTGAATVLAVIRAAAALKLPVHVTSWLPLAENMPSSTATRPGDVITARGGRTIEVLNTDAEGRLVLADALIAAGEESPDAIIDVATLTGAAITALGNRTVGLMGDDELVTSVQAASLRAGESLWPMPIPDELRPMLASDIADIANIKPGNTAAGMLIAAAFLTDFKTPVSGTTGATIPWAHLDIAGPAHNQGGAYGYTGTGPTGTMVRTLIDYLTNA
ncbi:leucyl aminopeptidase [Lysinibacter cavernae]|uniref:Probable cytosol aminopeptidase n=1 Tax=Lysinibacter cavernae TaxID=1640652 RepID=A0A7X5QZ51_9MICO|nr:leucyl aminopeptidase [Lysinibacter cavernae]NIH52648.1 leucyl aminopeptidase [Lysinibacter cavernae]